ncbi:hypothetical protein H6F74_09765 [Trichocoleus sp. FACHB-90]|uniref:DUF3226 domain-containing protein n=1 Tax=Cyanophyceae TaxID=3028117 RepID=UPI0016821FBD|nr:DUF3226 domain-containing protein [Trichocoleus sp. FACHB-90]MBD1926527.1 hypothetical protein [Trichocoleus sp. FACHB-90]
MPNTPQQLLKPKLLIGEGSEEVLFFTALLTHLNITDIQVEEYRGKQGLRNYLKTLLVRPGYTDVVSLAITRDADSCAKSAFQSVCSALNYARLAVPSKSGGIAGNSPQVGVMILPDDQNPGMLEDVCLAAVATDPVLQCVDKYFECVTNTTRRQPNNMGKARIRAWLSSQIDPDKRLGEAAKAGYLPWDSPAFDRLKQFLQAL